MASFLSLEDFPSFVASSKACNAAITDADFLRFGHDEDLTVLGGADSLVGGLTPRQAAYVKAGKTRPSSAPVSSPQEFAISFEVEFFGEAAPGTPRSEMFPGGVAMHSVSYFFQFPKVVRVRVMSVRQRE